MLFAGHTKNKHCITAGCKSDAAVKHDHDARRNDDATYRKTRKNSIRLRAPTTRPEVREFSSEGIEGGC